MEDAVFYRGKFLHSLVVTRFSYLCQVFENRTLFNIDLSVMVKSPHVCKNKFKKFIHKKNFLQ